MNTPPNRIYRTSPTNRLISDRGSIRQQLNRLERRLDSLDVEHQQYCHPALQVFNHRCAPCVPIRLFTIGSHPPGRHAYGVMVGDPVQITSRGAFKESTLNRASIAALAEALALTETGSVTLYTNTYYLADILGNQRLLQWERNRWRDTTDARRPNADLWSDPELMEATTRIKEVFYEPGYFGSPLTTQAHELAAATLEEMEAF